MKRIASSLLAVCFLVSALHISSESYMPHPVHLLWGVPDFAQMSLFAGLQRTPEGEEVNLDGHTLKLTWEKGKAYVVPLFAYSDDTLEGVRYTGTGIPQDYSIEWLDPINRVWYPFEAIPEAFVIAHTTFENHKKTIDFGPPEGAEFEKDKYRYIWFRVTPHQRGEAEIRIYGYAERPDGTSRRVTPEVVLEASVID